MFKSTFTQAAKILISLSLAVLPSTSLAKARLLSVADVTTSSTKLSEQLITQLDRNPEAQQKLIERGLSIQEVESRLAAMSDREIQQMMNQAGVQQAGGDIVISLTTVLLIVIIILLVD